MGAAFSLKFNLLLFPMERTLWVDRKFTFDFPEGWIFNILERLHGTEPRLRAIVQTLDNSQASLKRDDKWSIKEHIGHLYDLELLHDGRIDDFNDRKDTLRAADMSNALTNASNHNDKYLTELIDLFALRRHQLIAKVEALTDDVQQSRALHPRLQVMMRPIDVAYFTAEHDDHHLASIRELILRR